ncbi:MAG: type II toxin-antitoxin system HipA family toxin [Rhodospirillaceae bacterium]|jgi:serine/threonine-protein kinase HipA|nr:type II toxin-antitoxin system HipA family toxin [Rhodospirillaceae bacterium]MBT5243155.1 type II toxin-antitoxin system HipA family toxin [Rhodospirillaceae bacterium]MBT5563380.1 type II toxin-antitoxin system HipA family toxin [Rhodospirillaceae bacterium]MBT6243694.1 type II toxin-antitoxin system HipA family toxin [Rhodospirillaceae bacterium]MBT7137005.1 type II toxin-antitoxin system HipA family toxin [Rhodospirillaceae bacterium]
MKYVPVSEVKVGLAFNKAPVHVGRLATRDGVVYFEYDRDFLNSGLDVSPLRLPLQPGLRSFDRFLFEGLPGLFNDSLPDGWGRLLLDRFARGQGILPEQLGPLDRLAHVGNNGMGALVYEPDQSQVTCENEINLDALALQAREVLDGEAQGVLDELLALNGSSAGARPKVMVGVDEGRENIVHGMADLKEPFAPWIVKFSNSTDGLDSGAIEYVYGLMAQKAGLEMSDVHLFPADKGPGYFATRRFDRAQEKRMHVHSACGLLHSDFRTPSLDYEELITLTGMLTRDVREVEKMFRLAVFNVLAHNRDDHAKNFSFLMSDTGEWKLSPAYDLTFSSGPRGEQSTMVMGEGANPGIEHLKKLGEEAKLDKACVNEIIEETQDALANWPELAREFGVGRENIGLVKDKLSQQN